MPLLRCGSGMAPDSPDAQHPGSKKCQNRRKLCRCCTGSAGALLIEASVRSRLSTRSCLNCLRNPGQIYSADSAGRRIELEIIRRLKPDQLYAVVRKSLVFILRSKGVAERSRQQTAGERPPSAQTCRHAIYGRPTIVAPVRDISNGRKTSS